MKPDQKPGRDYVIWTTRTTTVRMRVAEPLPPAMRGPADVVSYLRTLFERLDAATEAFVVLALNAKNRITSWKVISIGSLMATTVHPREVFAYAITARAAGIVLAHNHPSGDPEPSDIDLDLTRRLVAVGELIGIRVLDHVVLGNDAHVSMLDRGLIVL